MKPTVRKAFHWPAGALSQRRVFFSLALGAIVLAGLVFGWPLTPWGQQGFLQAQRAALQLEFYADLQSLQDAPRYTIQASADPETGLVSGQMEVVYTNREADPINTLVFRLYPNARSIYGGGSLRVSTASLDGQEIDLSLSEDETTLTVYLPYPLAAGERLSASLTFEAQAPAASTTGYGIFNRAGGVMFLAGWYPVLAVYMDGWQTPEIPLVGDALQAEISLYAVSLALPEGYELVSTGTAVERQARGERVTWQLVSGPAREFAVVISDRYEMIESEHGDVTLRLHVLPHPSPAHTPQAGMEMLEDVFTAYEKRFGPYPYTEFDVVEALISIGGYEFPGLVTIDNSLRAQRSLADYRYLLAHEVAHQWWYGLVGSPTIAEPWLDEAHATYGAALYLEEAVSQRAAQGLINYWRTAYGIREPFEPPVNSPTLDFSSWAAYRSTVYIHGALFLHELRQEIGDEAFFELLLAYQAERRYEFAGTSDYLQMAEDLSGQELDHLFAAWFDLDAEAAGE